MGSRVEVVHAQESGTVQYDRLKIRFLTLTFFLVIGAYTFIQALKDSLFTSVVGKEYVPYAKFASMFVLIPAILIYSILVDRLRRYQVFSFYGAFFGIVGLLFTYFLAHPTIGISNTDTSPYRLFGWLFYFFVEGFSPFVVSVFWAFANSISDPDAAKKSYATIVSGSKLGGIFSSGLAWWLLSWTASNPGQYVDDILSHQIILGIASLMVLLIPVIIYFLMKKVPGRYMHGYEAAYQVEKQKKKEGKHETGLFSGIYLLFKYPYVLGIFAMIFFYEVVNTILSYIRISIAQSHTTNLSGMSGYFMKITFMVHVIGFLISFFGTGALLRRLGEQYCLLLVPILSGAVLLILMVVYTPTAFLISFVFLKAINYAFSWPVRESLYIPTVKEIKFKSKSWIDAFGGKFAKSSGSVFNLISANVVASMQASLYSFFFAGLVALWFVAALLLGRRFDKAIAHNEVIGADENE